MELDEMKNKWQQYDKVLQQNKMLNEKIVDMMLKEKSASVVKGILNIEYIGLTLTCILFIIQIVRYDTFTAPVFTSTCYIISLLVSIISIACFGYKINKLQSINLQEHNVSETAYTIERFRLFINKEQLISLITMPFIIVIMYDVVYYWLGMGSIVNHLQYHMLKIVTGSLFGIAAIVVIYRSLYFNNIKRIKVNLAEIEKFRSEVML